MAEADLTYAAPQPHMSYSLLELSPAMLAHLESPPSASSVDLSIVGQPSDESVLTTSDATLALRAVRSSNTMLLCQPQQQQQQQEGQQDKTELRNVASVHHTLDLLPVKARLERVDELLRGQEWSNSDPEDYRPSKKLKAYNEKELLDVVQASPAQLQAYLKQAHITRIGTRLRPVLPSYLPSLLSTFLLSLDDHGQAPTSSIANVGEGEEEDVRIAVEWYSATPDKTAVVRDLGLALLQSWPRDKLRASKNVAVGQRVKKQDVISVSDFMREWKKWAGSEQDLCQMDLLKGNFLQEDDDGVVSIPASELNRLEPAERFAFLFKLRPKWLPKDMDPFLQGITVDPKDREKWVLKCVRKVKQGKDMVWLPR